MHSFSWVRKSMSQQRHNTPLPTILFATTIYYTNTTTLTTTYYYTYYYTTTTTSTTTISVYYYYTTTILLLTVMTTAILLLLPLLLQLLSKLDFLLQLDDYPLHRRHNEYRHVFIPSWTLNTNYTNYRNSLLCARLQAGSITC